MKDFLLMVGFHEHDNHFYYECKDGVELEWFEDRETLHIEQGQEVIKIEGPTRLKILELVTAFEL